MGAGCGVVMVVGGLLALEGSRWGYLLGAGAAVALVVGGGLFAAARRTG